MTKRQRQVYDYLRAQRSKQTQAEIAQAFGVLRQTMRLHLLALRRAGVVTWQVGKHRGVEVVV